MYDYSNRINDSVTKYRNKKIEKPKSSKKIIVDEKKNKL